MRSQTRNTLKVLIVFFVLLLIIINSRLIPSPLRAKVLDLGAPSLKLFRSASDGIKGLMPFSRFREENDRLRVRVDVLNRQVSEIKVVREENRRLLELLNFRKIPPYATVPSQVIGRDPSNWANTLIIDKGSSGGVVQGKAVMSTKGLVGRVVEVGRYSSKVLLISDVNSKVGVLILRNRQGGILVGRPDGKCKMVYIALDSDVAPGDKVITAGFGGVFPKDVMVGEVVSVYKEPGRLYKYAVIRPSQNLSKTEEVLCVK